jgi:hypothetical protein
VLEITVSQDDMIRILNAIGYDHKQVINGYESKQIVPLESGAEIVYHYSVRTTQAGESPEENFLNLDFDRFQSQLNWPLNLGLSSQDSSRTIPAEQIPVTLRLIRNLTGAGEIKFLLSDGTGKSGEKFLWRIEAGYRTDFGLTEGNERVLRYHMQSASNGNTSVKLAPELVRSLATELENLGVPNEYFFEIL